MIYNSDESVTLNEEGTQGLMGSQCLLEPVDDGLVQCSPINVFKASIENHMLTSGECIPKNIVLWIAKVSKDISIVNGKQAISKLQF